MKVHEAVNFNIETDDFTQAFLHQNIQQFWTPEEVVMSRDKKHWSILTDDQKDVLKKNLIGLTLLDTEQGNVGMPKIGEATEDDQRKALINYMAFMENGIHARGYSHIFVTLLSTLETNELFEWSKEQRHLQYKARIITSHYNKALDSKKDYYMALVASVFLESLLFYSGFFYPLYLAGKGYMKATADMINLILRDESIHGPYIGLLAQEVYQEFPESDRQEMDGKVTDLLEDLVANEEQYTHEVYAKVDLAHKVNEFVKYNANKAMSILGKSAHYKNVQIDPIVEAGMSTETKANEIFSTKGNGYIKANVVPLESHHLDFIRNM